MNEFKIEKIMPYIQLYIHILMIYTHNRAKYNFMGNTILEVILHRL